MNAERQPDVPNPIEGLIEQAAYYSRCARDAEQMAVNLRAKAIRCVVALGELSCIDIQTSVPTLEGMPVVEIPDGHDEHIYKIYC
jgi:hypothetical protein